jgi:protein-S-isoprenylcysteine O-methyltransferase Ste14
MTDNGLYVRTLVQIAQFRHGATYKIVAMACGTIVFLCVMPLILVAIVGLGIHPGDCSFVPRAVEWIFAPVEIAVGLATVAWAALTQWTIGRGTPAPVAPTQRLVVSGPYKLCRNPIELGAIFYYLGIGTLYGGTTFGIACMAIGLVIGSAYHRFVEEKELVARFGAEYEEYRKTTPFLIPRCRKTRATSSPRS